MEEGTVLPAMTVNRIYVARRRTFKHKIKHTEEV